jgi:hypothetical protein
MLPFVDGVKQVFHTDEEIPHKHGKTQDSVFPEKYVGNQS